MVVNVKVKQAGDMKLRVQRTRIEKVNQTKTTAENGYIKKDKHVDRSSVIQKSGVSFFVSLGLYFLFHCHIHTVFQM